MARITRERAYEVLSLDVETGVLTWRVAMGSRGKAGVQAGSFHKASGYRFVTIDGKKHREHLVIWLMVYGEWLPREIDHHDLDRANNRPSNLRRATESQQRSNGKLRSDNTTGERGVTLNKGVRKYSAEIWHRGVKQYLGSYATLEEAAAVARSARLKVFGEFAPSYDHPEGT